MTDEIERFKLCHDSDPSYRSQMLRRNDGNYVRYTDHLAAMQAKDARIAELEGVWIAEQKTAIRVTEQRNQLRAENERLRYEIHEASDPDFLFGAMDNVNDMDVSITQFAEAASRAIRAALQRKAGE